MKEVEIRQLRYFVAAAENLHFGKAAAQLGITQSALSQQIAALEKEIGAALFKRDRRNVHLTEEGNFLYAKSEDILTEFDSAIAAVKKLKNGRQGTECIVLGLIEHSYLQLMVPAMTAMKKIYPNIKFERKEMGSNVLSDGLVDRDIDVGMGIHLPQVFHAERVSHASLMKGHWAVLVDKNHRFAKRKSLDLKDLTKEKLIVFARSLNPYLYDAVAQCFTKALLGTPDVIYETTQVQAGVRMVENGIGVMLSADYVLNDVSTKTVMIPVHGIFDLSICVFWRKDESSGVVLDFVELVEEEAAKLKSTSLASV